MHYACIVHKNELAESTCNSNNDGPTVADLRFDKGGFKSKIRMRERLTKPTFLLEFQGEPPTF